MGGSGSPVSELHGRCRQKGMMRVVRRGQFAERCDRIGIGSGSVLRATEMNPKPLRMIGIEPHRPTNPLDPLFGTSEPGEQLPLLHDDKIAVRI
jgi:hypothetical protein